MSEKLEIFGEIADVERIVTGEANVGKVATDGLTKSARELLSRMVVDGFMKQWSSLGCEHCVPEYVERPFEDQRRIRHPWR